MKIIKTTNGKAKIKISRKEWEGYGRQAGWGFPFSEMKDAWKTDRLDDQSYVENFIKQCLDQSKGDSSVVEQIGKLQQLISDESKKQEFIEYAKGQMGFKANIGPCPKNPLTVLKRFINEDLSHSRC